MTTTRVLVLRCGHMAGSLHRYTYADYVALEESSTTKHEYFQDEIYAMAGGSEDLSRQLGVTSARRYAPSWARRPGLPNERARRIREDRRALLRSAELLDDALRRD